MPELTYVFARADHHDGDSPYISLRAVIKETREVLTLPEAGDKFGADNEMYKDFFNASMDILEAGDPLIRGGNYDRAQKLLRKHPHVDDALKIFAS